LTTRWRKFFFDVYSRFKFSRAQPYLWAIQNYNYKFKKHLLFTVPVRDTLTDPKKVFQLRGEDCNSFWTGYQRLVSLGLYFRVWPAFDQWEHRIIYSTNKSFENKFNHERESKGLVMTFLDTKLCITNCVLTKSEFDRWFHKIYL
jgi:hypothetical protein